MDSVNYDELVQRLRAEVCTNHTDDPVWAAAMHREEWASRAADAITELQARVAELEAEQATWLASDDLIAQRAERAEADLAAARAELDTCRANFIHETQQLAAARALLLEVNARTQGTIAEYEEYLGRIDAALAGKDAT
jgi:chromosome segregation ATPase